ncbi:MAG TPA: protoporphyrinogen oxidase HemJ [Steroidobacteraceae bacterium]|jgi:putative membrane protein|nr:protoporphyrinogen oxidase HemJ [Steroidobacteraceae bacterium]
MLWLKAFHVVSVVSWFAALLYLPRLFVYHAQIQGTTIDDAVGNARFKVMERKLFKLMTLAAIMAVSFGVSMLAVAPEYLLMRWLHVKLLLVLLLISYHGACFALVQQFANDRNSRSERWYRVFNEIPALLLIGIVVLVVVKPF